jgi:two-component system CheB/CheR fusion protein
MPEMNGYEVCRELRSLPDQRDTLIIAASGFGQDHDLSKARDAGFDHHLIKPMDPTLLARYLREGR